VWRDSRGFTLAELLVALALTLIVTGAALTALMDTFRASEASTLTSDVNQNLRVSMNVLIRDLLEAGQGIPTGGIPFPTGGSTPVVRPGPAPVGEQAAVEYPEEWVTLPAVMPGQGLGPEINGVHTDIVTVLYVDQRLSVDGRQLQQVFLRTCDCPNKVSTIADDGSSVTIPNEFPIDDPGRGIKSGDLIMFTNGIGTAIQEVTEVNGQTIVFDSAAESNLNQRTAPQGTILGIRDDDDNFPTETTAARVMMVTYYLKVPSPTSGNVVITAPHFMRRVNFGPERIVGIGVENLQMTWDLVDDQNEMTNVEDPEAPNQIRKANLVASARSLQKFATIGDYVRSSLITQVSLRSMAFVDRYQ
jgi:prepilin-type N-terminal cleavage/methylation domain-containing protein